MNISPRFKKILKRLIIISVVGFVLYCLFIVGWFLFMASGGIAPEMPIPAEALMHKSKAEILEIAFAEDAPRIRALDNQVNIAIYDKRGRCINNLYFNNIEEARQDERLENSNEWEFYGITSIWSNGTHSWKINFKDDKVVEVERSGKSDF